MAPIFFVVLIQLLKIGLAVLPFFEARLGAVTLVDNLL